MGQTADGSTINCKERDAYIKVVDMWDIKGTIYSDRAGQFPVTLCNGHRYIMVMVAVNSNAILVIPLKSKKDE